MTCPSLQDPIWQELDSNFLVLRKKPALTRPSLQDFDCVAFCPALSEALGYVPHIPDVGSYIVASNRGSVPSSTAGPPAGYPGSLGHFSSFGVANVFSSHAGTLSCYSIDDS